MYKRILLPTDGSELSHACVTAGLEFAQQLQAEVVAVYVAGNYQYPLYVDILPPNGPTEEEYQAAMQTLAESYLQPAREAANAAGLAYQEVIQFNDSTAKEIVHTAQEYACDLIFMGSHGRSGLGQFILGSVTTKVLSLCLIPVLVHRIKHH
ncbi:MULTISPECIES: universal stress protein [Undibacterium]|jgi:nucleotide-binding universal stress UspA family protein|uniref:Universal stress protein n=1 Tax=Undibacterium umbellatum TaxID=2762300 RepID=A0ABR6ZB66_9BURK|nr:MULTISPECIES: universal stress protein [Undibacterium]MBC3909007.1 universal stress protein [Undibacterium umbellatum]MDP1976828.1 universal stress protein [Undibacterium sp.]